MDTSSFHELLVGLEHLQAARYYVVAPVAILYYDWFLTLPEEVNRYWRPKFTGPTILFLLNRYLPVIGFIPTMISYFSGDFSPAVRFRICVTSPATLINNDTISDEQVCAKHVVPFALAANLVSQSLIGIVLLLRTYAIYERSGIILLFLIVAWSVEIGVGIWGASSLVPLMLPPGISGCLPHSPDNSKFRLAAAYMGVLFYEAFIYGLTLWKTLRYRQNRAYFSIPDNTLIGTIIRDGSVYFIVLLGANLLTILLICLAESDLRTINVTFNHIIPVTIISRLLLNLRKEVQVEGSTGRTLTDWQLTSGINQELMSAVLGNIGSEFEQGIFSGGSIITGSDQKPNCERGLEGETIGLSSIR
ncbi:hypothetical protein K439DRAFT_1164453 [Ramaria rubella]|nr:hypothetical protein K439DRAFT_1164453 [Ramaria rubella]